MRWVIVLTIVVICFSCTFSSAQTLEYINSTFWSGLYDVKVDGHLAYCAYTNGLVIMEVNNPMSPVFGTLISQFYVQGGTFFLEKAGDFVFLVSGYNPDSTLQMIDVSDPLNPTLAGRYETSRNLADVFVSGQFAYLFWNNDQGRGALDIVDFGDPANPTLVGTHLPLFDARANCVFVSGGQAYLGWRSNTSDMGLLEIVDVGDPIHPASTGIYNSTDQPSDIFVSDNLAYMSVSSSFEIVDVSDSTTPIFAGSCETPSGASSVFVAGGHAYVTCWSWYGWKGLISIDVSQPTNPFVAGRYPMFGVYSRVFVSDSYAYLSNFSQLLVFDVSAPSRFVLAGRVGNLEFPQKVFVLGNHAYVGMKTFDYHTYQPSSVIEIFNVSDPNTLTRVGSYQTPWEDIGGLFVSGNYAYLSNSSEGLQIIDVSNPENPTFAGSYETDEAGGDLFVSGNFAFVSCGSSGILKMDISDPTMPVLAGSLETPEPVGGIFVSGDHAYTTWCDGNPSIGGLRIIDVSFTSNSPLIGSCGMLEEARKVFVSDHHAYVTDCDYGLRIIDVIDPSTPVYVGGLETQDHSSNSCGSGNHVWMACENSGVQLVDVSDPSNPVLAGSYDTPGHATDVASAGDYVFVTDYNSLIVLRANFPKSREEMGARSGPLSLGQNSPNPFNASTTISYDLKAPALVSIQVFDVQGRKVDTILQKDQQPGRHHVEWSTEGQASGVYFYRIRAGDLTETKKMVLVK